MKKFLKILAVLATVLFCILGVMGIKKLVAQNWHTHLIDRVRNLR